VPAVNAPLFKRLIENLSPERRSVVLDFGPARAETVALFGQFRSRLDIADLGGGLPGLAGESDPAQLKLLAEELLPRRRPEPTDVVLCWDTLNYLPRPALSALMGCVAARCRPGTWVHLLIVYSGNRMRARPNHYGPQADGRLLTFPTADTEIDAPRYSPEDLRQYIRGFRVDSASLLKNGMQEFLLRA
jgi:hypothetical protein